MINRKFVFESNEAMYRVSKKEKAMPHDTVGFLILPTNEIHLNKRNAEIISDSARELGISLDEFVNKLIENDVIMAKKFHSLSDEVKNLLE